MVRIGFIERINARLGRGLIAAEGNVALSLAPEVTNKLFTSSKFADNALVNCVWSIDSCPVSGSEFTPIIVRLLYGPLMALTEFRSVSRTWSMMLETVMSLTRSPAFEVLSLGSAGLVSAVVQVRSAL